MSPPCMSPLRGSGQGSWWCCLSAGTSPCSLLGKAPSFGGARRNPWQKLPLGWRERNGSHGPGRFPSLCLCSAAEPDEGCSPWMVAPGARTDPPDAGVTGGKFPKASLFHAEVPCPLPHSAVPAGALLGWSPAIFKNTARPQAGVSREFPRTAPLIVLCHCSSHARNPFTAKENKEMSARGLKESKNGCGTRWLCVQISWCGERQDRGLLGTG